MIEGRNKSILSEEVGVRRRNWEHKYYAFLVQEKRGNKKGNEKGAKAEQKLKNSPKVCSKHTDKIYELFQKMQQLHT